MKTLSRRELLSALVKRKPEDHKGVFGHVLIVAGSRGMGGAAILSARAALRSGAGLVTLAVPSGLQAGVAPQVPEALTLGLPENSLGCLRPEAAEKLQAAQKERGFSVLAMGPGLSQHPDAARFVVRTLKSLDIAAVLDADALNILAALAPRRARETLRARKSGAVFTPHPGEMARCLRLSSAQVQADRAGCARRLALEWDGVAALKGHRTVISNGRRSIINLTGGPGLAKGGSGDVLTGLIAGLWAQMIASGRVNGELGFLAGALGCFLHGRAGELAEKARTPWAMTAQDVVESLPLAFESLGVFGRKL